MAPGGVDQLGPVLGGSGGGGGAVGVEVAPGEAQGAAEVALRVVQSRGRPGLPQEEIAQELVIVELGKAVFHVPEPVIAAIVEVLGQVGGVAEVAPHLGQISHRSGKLAPGEPEVGIF